MRATLFHLIGCYYASDEARYLRPIRTMLRNSLLRWSVRDVPSAGTLDRVVEVEWTGLLEQLALVAILYREASGDRQFDAAARRWAERVRRSLVDGVKSYVLLNRRDPKLWYVDRPLDVGAYRESRRTVGAQLYLGWLVTGDEDYLARLGWNLSSTLTDKWGAFSYWFYDKAEPRVTSNDHLAHKLQSSATALSLMYLGGPGPIEAVWPQLAVSWQGVGNNFCALVREHGPQRLTVHLYNFDPEPRRITALLWELAPGRYEATIGPDADGDAEPNSITWRAAINAPQPGQRRQPIALELELPGRTLIVLRVFRTEPPCHR